MIIARLTDYKFILNIVFLTYDKMEGFASDRRKLILVLAFITGWIMPALSSPNPNNTDNHQDTNYIRQQLHNGRVWEKRYDQVSGHEFFMTEALSEASLTIGERTFNDQLIWYDIYNDRIVLMVRPGFFIEVTGENAVRFTFRYLNASYLFRYFGEKGYFHLLHEGRVLLVRKYVKTIKKNAVNGSFDAFEEGASDYLIKEGNFTRIRSRKDLFNVLKDRETEVRHFIREQDIWVNPKRPESIIPVLIFYESL